MARAQKVRIARQPTALGILARGTWRYVTGRPLVDGEPRTDATWVHKGTRSYGDTRAAWWWYQTKTLRVGVRLAGAGSVLGTGYGLAMDPAATLAGLHGGAVGIGSLGAAVASYKLTDAALAFTHNRDYVWPLHVVLMEALALPRGTRPRHYLTVPRDFNTVTGEAVWVEVPPAAALATDARRRVEAALTAKLALQDVTFGWHTTGGDHHVAVKQLPRPPKRAAFAEEYVRRAVETAAPDAPVIGISHSRKVIAHSIDSDAPHVLVIMGTGGGKSVLLRSLSAQLMHHGAEVILLDFKQTSQPYMRRIRGIRYARDISAIHEALIYMGEVGHERRTKVAKWIDQGGDPDKEQCPHITHRLCLFFEEINSTLKELKKYWERIRSKDDPKESPAITAYFQALNMGRSEKMHVIAVGQEGRESEIGSRNSYGLRILGSYDKKLWNLIAETGTAPKKSGEKGRVQVVYAGEATETQGLFFTNEEAIEWATTGTGRTATRPAASAPEAEIAQPLPGEELPAPETVSHTHAHTTAAPSQPARSTPEPHTSGRESETAPAAAPLPDNVIPFQRQGEPDADAEPEPAPADLVNMSQASKDKGRGVLPMTATAIRGARRDDPEFPDPDGVDARGNDAWKPETLMAWFKNRPRTANKS